MRTSGLTFFRSAFVLLRKDGTSGLIATNTISQGDTRATGLTTILGQGGAISHTIRRLKWPGEAAVVISVLHVRNGAVGKAVLDGKPVRRISAFLMDGDLDDTPGRLAQNAKTFNGTKIYGQGFLFADGDDESTPLAEMNKLLDNSPDSMDLIQSYIGGEDLNNSPNLKPSRYAINFGDRSLSLAEQWPELLAIVRAKVLPERMKTKDSADGRNLKENWWLYFRPKHELYAAISRQQNVLAIAETAPHLSVALVPVGSIYSHALKIICLHTFHPLATLQSRIHEVWARFFASSMKDDLRYTPSDCFATFPFPHAFETSPTLEAAGQAYHDHRAALMIARNEGLTKTYNRFHTPAEDSPDIVRLRELHGAMDHAVLTAYGWTDLVASAVPEHLTEATEDDHKYQGRYFWPAPIRDDVLARLLALNATRAEEERLAGLTPAASDDEAEDGDSDDSE